MPGLVLPPAPFGSLPEVCAGAAGKASREVTLPAIDTSLRPLAPPWPSSRAGAGPGSRRRRGGLPPGRGARRTPIMGTGVPALDQPQRADHAGSPGGRARDAAAQARLRLQLVRVRTRGGPPHPETLCPWPVSPYRVTKLAAEHLCELYRTAFGVPTVSLRLFTVYGPWQRPDMAFARLVAAAVRDEPFVLSGDGE